MEHFSPYCGHCKSFAPTWAQLAGDTASTPDPGIQLAQVNCVVHGDLCTANKISGYPQLNLYRNGEFVETYKKARDYDLLLAYINKHSEPTSKPKIAAPSVTTPAAIQAPTTTKPVEVLHVQTPRADINPSGAVIPLTPDNFQDVIDQSPTFVKFFAPWYVQYFAA